MDVIYAIVTKDGDICFIWDDALAFLIDLGKPEIKRASHVEPTRDGRWVADLSPVNGPVLGPFRLRQEALDAEREWLSKHIN